MTSAVAGLLVYLFPFTFMNGIGLAPGENIFWKVEEIENKSEETERRQKKREVNHIRYNSITNCVAVDG